MVFKRGLNRLRKKTRLQVEIPKSVPPGLKPSLILRVLCGGRKSRLPTMRVFPQPVKPVPFHYNEKLPQVPATVDEAGKVLRVRGYFL
jgi:hypothetical protein